MKGWISPSCAGLLLSAAFTTAVVAQSGDEAVAAFYKGKTVNVLIGDGVGRIRPASASVARYIGRHIPGNPNIVPQNMLGAGGVKMVAYLLQSQRRTAQSRNDCE